MKILHITSSTKGGAGIAAYRLHLGLLNEGINSSILCVKNKIIDAPQVVIVENPKYSIFKRVLHKIIPTIKSVKNKKILEKLEGTYEIATFPTTDYQIHKHPLVKNATIIHLHWIGDFLDYPSFFKNCKKPIVWTLHDMNPFKGCFHYKFDDESNKQHFKILNKKIRLLKKRSFQKSSIHTIVAPSNWLLQESEKSCLLGQFPHKHIYNGADEQIFKAIATDKAREKLKLPKDKIIFLFVSQNISCHRKGFDIIEGVINELNTKEVLFVAIGKPPVIKNEKIHYLGTISSSEIMAQAYSACNAFLLPSREDNLPNTMVESLLCGTPVISSNIGGMAEVIVDGKNGYLVDETTISAFKIKILKFIDTKGCFNKNAIALNAQTKFSKKTVSTNYFNLYKSIFND